MCTLRAARRRVARKAGPSMRSSRWPRAAESWSWADYNSGAGPPRTAAPGLPSRSSPRSWGRASAGDGDHDQDDEELQPVASSTSDATVRDAGEGGAACRRPAPSLPILRVSREKFLHELKAGPAVGRTTLVGDEALPGTPPWSRSSRAGTLTVEGAMARCRRVPRRPWAAPAGPVPGATSPPSAPPSPPARRPASPPRRSTECARSRRPHQ
jgi:hypothetical protein